MATRDFFIFITFYNFLKNNNKKYSHQAYSVQCDKGNVM